MAKGRILGGLAAGPLLLGTATYAAAQAPPPSVADMLTFCEPKQKGIAISTPTADEQKACTVKPATGAAGWVLLDPKNRPLRHRTIATVCPGPPPRWVEVVFPDHPQQKPLVSPVTQAI